MVAASSKSLRAANVSTCLIYVSRFWRPLYMGGWGAFMLSPRLLLGTCAGASSGDTGDDSGRDPDGVLAVTDNDLIDEKTGDPIGDPNSDPLGES